MCASLGKRSPWADAPMDKQVYLPTLRNRCLEDAPGKSPIARPGPVAFKIMCVAPRGQMPPGGLRQSETPSEQPPSNGLLETDPTRLNPLTRDPTRRSHTSSGSSLLMEVSTSQTGKTDDTRSAPKVARAKWLRIAYTASPDGAVAYVFLVTPDRNCESWVSGARHSAENPKD